jgi:hypothetical protein
LFLNIIYRLDNLKIQAKAISLSILDFNQKVQTESLYNEFFNGIDAAYDESGYAVNDDISSLISTEDADEFNKCMFCGNELPWDSKSFCRSCGTLLINNRFSFQVPKPIKRNTDFFAKLDDYEDDEDETYSRNKRVFRSLEEAFLSPDDCRSRVYDFDDGDDWQDYDE